MFNAQGKLDIFENFRVDRRLKAKPDDGVRSHRIRSKADAMMDASDFEDDIVMSGDDYNIFFSGDASVVLNPLDNVAVTQSLEKLSWFHELIHSLRLFFGGQTKQPELTIQEFFSAAKGSMLDVEIVRQRAQGYEDAIRNAKACGQQALVESLSQNLVGVRAEAHLVSLDMCKYLTEEKLVEFVKKSPKGIRLDWIANFTRVVPNDLMVKKARCDERFVFDNYVILHYDPQAKSYAETEAEREARKDPIMFGVIKGRRRLYYVGDWVDEYCDLTLDQVADALGSQGISKIS